MVNMVVKFYPRYLLLGTWYTIDSNIIFNFVNQSLDDISSNFEETLSSHVVNLCHYFAENY